MSPLQESVLMEMPACAGHGRQAVEGVLAAHA